MKKAFGMIELLLALVVIIVVAVMMNRQTGAINPFEASHQMQTQKEEINKRVDEIQDMKKFNEQIQKNLVKEAE